MVEGFRVYGLGWSGFLGLVFQVLRDSLFFVCGGGGPGLGRFRKEVNYTLASLLRFRVGIRTL